jgi:hypothetical protein
MKLTRLNPTTVFLAALAVVLAGLFAPGAIGAIVLLAVAAGLIWLMTRTWAVQTPGTRAVRVLILALLATAALTKLLS